MAELGKEQDCLREYGQSVIGANFRAFAAMRALQFIDDRHGNITFFPL